jgi:hypothetical protein
MATEWYSLLPNLIPSLSIQKFLSETEWTVPHRLKASNLPRNRREKF